MAWLTALGTVVTSVTLLMPTLVTYGSGTFKTLLLLLAVSASFAVGLFALARSIRQQRPWARAGGIVFGSVALFAFPIGTVVGSYVLWQLLFHWHALDGTRVRPASLPRATAGGPGEMECPRSG